MRPLRAAAVCRPPLLADSGVYKGLPIRSRPHLLRSILAAAAAAAQGTAPASPGVSHSQQQSGSGSGGDAAEVSSSSTSGAGAAVGGALLGGSSKPSPTLSGLQLGGVPGAAAETEAAADAGGGLPSKSSPGKPRRNGKKAARRR
jgi:hypothetical protein